MPRAAAASAGQAQRIRVTRCASFLGGISADGRKKTIRRMWPPLRYVREVTQQKKGRTANGGYRETHRGMACPLGHD